MVAQYPVKCHIRLVSGGRIIVELSSDRLEHTVITPGVYRVEAWLEVDREERPWVFSNPIYLR